MQVQDQQVLPLGGRPCPAAPVGSLLSPLDLGPGSLLCLTLLVPSPGDHEAAGAGAETAPEELPGLWDLCPGLRLHIPKLGVRCTSNPTTVARLVWWEAGARPETPCYRPSRPLPLSGCIP